MKIGFIGIGNIGAPMVVIAGDVDKTVSTNIHSRPLAAVVPNAKLIVLPGVGHMVQNAAPDLVISEIEAMIGKRSGVKTVDGKPDRG